MTTTELSLAILWAGVVIGFAHLRLVRLEGVPMTDDPAPLALAVAALIACAWLWLALELRHMRRRLDRHAERLRTHQAHLTQYGAALAGHLPPRHQPVGKAWTGTMVPIDHRPPSVLPPARQTVTSIEQALADSPRPLTGVELAKALGVKPWDLLPQLDPLVRGGRVEFAPSHTIGQAAYRLAGDTLRLPVPNPPARPEMAR